MTLAPNLRVERKPNHFLATVSVALVLFLLGMLGLGLVQGSALLKFLREEVDIIVELSTETDTEGPDQVRDFLLQQSYLKQGSLRYVDRETALKQMNDDFGAEVVALDLPNPLYDAFLFNVNAEQLHPDSLARIRSEINNLSPVSDVYYENQLVSQLATNVRRIALAALGVALLALLVGLVLIHNTIRLSLYSNRFLIKTQELVGATWGFISRPYLERSLIRGAVSGLVAAVAVFAINYWLLRTIPDLRYSQSPLTMVLLSCSLIFFGMLINWLSTYYAVRKYLRLREDDLY